MARKIFAILLSALMIFPMLPGTALAESTVYTVAFDSQGGSAVDSISAEQGATISAPANPEKTGYAFEGWFKEPTCENAWDFGADTVTGDVTLYAKWTITVTFKDWDGTTLKEDSVSYGGTATAPSDPTRTGYSFAGWDTAFDNITSALIVTAQYTANQYTVTFDAQDGTVSPTNKTVTFGSAYGELPVPAREGYAFSGWYTQAAGEGSLVTAETIVDIAENHTLYAKWTAVVYTVSNAQELADSLAVVQTGETIKLAADITYTSRIAIINKDVTFDVGTHTLTVSVTNNNVIYVDNGAIRLITTGGEFNAQSSGPTAYGVYVQNGSIVEITNINADYYCVDAGSGSTVTVRGNAVSSGYGVISSDVGSSVTVEGNVTGRIGAKAQNGGVVTIDGILTGTYKYVELSYSMVKSKGQFTSPTTKPGYVTYSDVTSTVWVKAKPATVTFTVDGEEFAARTVMESESIGSGQWPVSPVKEGYEFRGWFTGENGTGTPLSADTPVVDTISVYALWRSNTPHTHFVGTAAALTSALTAAQDGDVIRLTSNITYNVGIVLNTHRELTIDVGVYTLAVNTWNGAAIDVGSGGKLFLDDDEGGALNASAYGYGDEGVYVHDGGFAEVSRTTSGTNTFGYGVIVAGAGSHAIVRGNVTGYYGACARGGGTVTVDGRIINTSAYIEIETTTKAKSSFTLPTTKDGYLTYTNGISTIWVKAQPCTVTFMVDGVQYATRTIMDSESIGGGNWPEDPTKLNNVFLGWYTTASGTGTQFTADTRIVANVTVYTRWRTTFPVATPAELTAALAAAKSGDTIKLTASFTYVTAINISSKDLTFDVGEHTLTVGPTTSSHTIEVSSGGSLLLNDAGGGALNIVENGSNSCAVYASGADIVEVTNITLSGDSSYGIYSTSSTVSVRGNITVTGNSAFGVYADRFHVTVGGDVTAYNGVKIYYNTDVIIDGLLTVSNDYVTLDSIRKSKSDITLPTTKDGYLTYTDGTKTVWVKVKPCTVTFQSAGATYITQPMIEGEAVGSGNWPADPVRDGYAFGGWYTAEYGAGTQFTEGTIVAGDMTVYARWIGGDYTVTLDAQGGTIDPGSVTVTFGNPYGELPAPIREGYVFTGWYTQQGGAGTKIEPSSFVSVEANHSLFAKWRDHNLTVGTSQQFGQAIAVAVTGDTIHLTGDITYRDYVIITGKDITIDVGAYTLTLYPNQSTYPALEVGSEGRLRLNDDGGGRLGISAAANGIYAHSGGVVDVSSAVAYAAGTSYCIYSTGTGSCVTIRGDVVAEGVAAKAENGGEIEIQGNVEVRRDGSIGAEATGAGSQVTVLGSIASYYGMDSNLVGVRAAGGKVTVLGYVEMSGANGIGVQTQGAGSEVSILVGIQADGANGLAVSADGGTVYAGYYIQAYDVVWAQNGAEVTLDGISYVTHDFIRLGNPPQLVTTPTVPTTQEGYDTYTDGVSTVWDRIVYTIIAAPNNASRGSVTGAGSYLSGTSVTLTAKPKAGYRFVRWLDGTTQVSTDATYSFAASEDISLTAEFVAIGTPTITVASAGYSSLKVSWSAIAGATGYEVWRSTTATGTYTKRGTTAGTTYTDTGLATGTAYYYKVKAYCVASTATTYGSLSAYSYAKPIPATPASFAAATASYTSIRVSWGAVAGATQYELYRAASSGGTYTLLTTTTALTYTNTSLTTGTAYYYKVRAYRLVGSTKVYGGFTASAGARPTLGVPSSVRAVIASYNSVKVTWGAVTGASGYELYRHSSTNSTDVLVVATTALNYTNVNLSTGSTYYYKVRAYRLISGRKVYGSYSPESSATPALTAPTAVVAMESSPTTVKISWGAVAGATKYEIWSVDGVGDPDILLAETASIYYINTGTTSGMSYSYQVRAYRLVGSTKVYGAFAASRWTFMPSSVSAAAVSYNSVSISWSEVSGVAGYEVYRATASTGTYTKVFTTDQEVYVNAGLTTGITYYYKVRAYKQVDTITTYGDFSPAVSAKPIPSVPASFTAASASYSSIKIAWGAVTGATQYELYRAASSGGTYTLLTTTTALTYTNTSLTTGTAYYYKVRAYRLVGSTKVYGGFTASAGARPTLGVPSSVQAVIASYNSVKVTWGAVTGASGYELYRHSSTNSTDVLVVATTALTYTNVNLSSGSTYYYKVRAYRLISGRKVYGAFSAESSCTPTLAVPPLVTAVRASATSIKISWGAVSGATMYEIWSVDTVGGTDALLMETTALTYTNTGLTTGAGYSYKVRAYRLVGSTEVYSGFSAIVSATP